MPNRDDGTRDERDEAAANEGGSGRKGGQQGPQGHAEGQHGKKAHQAFLQELHSGHSGEARDEKQSLSEPRGSQDNPEGKHRLFEDRQLLAQAYIERSVSATASAGSTRDEVRAFYAENPALFAERRIYRLRELAVSAPAEMIDVLRAEAAKARDLEAVQAAQPMRRKS